MLINQCVYNYRIHEDSFVRQSYINVCDLREKLMPYQIEFCSDINNKRLINYFCGEYLKDFVGGLYLRKLKNSKTDCKNYYHKKINQEEFKFCLKNSKFCNSKIKIVKLVLKTKIFSFAYLLSKIYYNKKIKNRMKNNL